MVDPVRGSDPEPGFSGNFHKGWWDEAGQRYWATWAASYTSTVVPTQISVRTLNDNLTTSNFKQISLQGISAKRVYGGCVAVPASFQAAYAAGPFACGFGGSTSLVAQGGGASMGDTMYFFGDPDGYTNRQTLRPGTFKTAMDFSPGVGTLSDWYANKVVGDFDRGRRIPSTPPLRNFADYVASTQPLTLSGTVNTSGNIVTWVSESFSRQFDTCPLAAWPKVGRCWWIGLDNKFIINNVPYTVAAYIDATHVRLTTAPPPQTGATFTSPSPFDATPFFSPSQLPGAFYVGVAPDGFERMTTVDAGQGACWFSRGTKTGLISLWANGAGDVAYADALIGATATQFVLRVFGYPTLGAGVTGATKSWKVYPDAQIDITSMLPLGIPGGTLVNSWGSGSAGISCDEDTGDIWIRANKAGEGRPGFTNYDFIYQLRCAACAALPPAPVMPLAASVLAFWALGGVLGRRRVA